MKSAGRSAARAPPWPARAVRQRLEDFGDLAQDRFGIERPGDRHDAALGHVASRVVSMQERDIEAVERAERAGDRKAQRMTRKCQRAQQSVGVHRAPVLVEALQNLFADDALFHVQTAENRLQQHLGQDPHELAQVLRRRGQAERAVVDVGHRRQRAAQRLEGERQRVSGRIACGSAMQHVLEEMTDAVVRGALEARTDARVDVDHPAAHVRHAHCADAQPVR